MKKLKNVIYWWIISGILGACTMFLTGNLVIGFGIAILADFCDPEYNERFPVKRNHNDSF